MRLRIFLVVVYQIVPEDDFRRFGESIDLTRNNLQLIFRSRMQIVARLVMISGSCLSDISSQGVVKRASSKYVHHLERATTAALMKHITGN